MLANLGYRDQTDDMKSFPGTAVVCAAIILGVSGILAVRSLPPKRGPRPTIVGVERRFELILPEREEVQDISQFCDKLKSLKNESVLYSFDISYDSGKHEECCKPDDCSASALSVKVDKVTTFHVTEGSVNGLTPIGSHVTQRIYSDKPEDIAFVLALLKTGP